MYEQCLQRIAFQIKEETVHFPIFNLKFSVYLVEVEEHACSLAREEGITLSAMQSRGRE